MQAVPQLPAHVALRFGPGAGQGVQEVPQLDTLVLPRHSLLHLWKPSPQVKSHAPFTQLGEEWEGTGQLLQLEPQLCALSAVQLPAQSLKPALHASEHPPDLHAAEALSRAFVHATQLVPQLIASSRMQLCPQR